MLRLPLSVCIFSIPQKGWFPGAGNAGRLSSGQGGLCEAADRKRSQYAPFPHAVQTGGALQHGKKQAHEEEGMYNIFVTQQGAAPLAKWLRLRV